MRFDRSSFAASRTAFVLLLAAAAFLAGCSSSAPVRPVTTPLSRVTLSPHADTLAVGGERQFVATAYDTSDAATSGVALSWRSSDPVVCQVAGTGLATAVGEGSALVIVSAGGKSDTARVYVKSALRGWYAQTSGTASNLNGIFFLADGRTGFAVGAGGALVATTNGGATWTPRSSGASLDLTSVWFSDATTGWAVGRAGTLVKTTNAGAKWTAQTNLPTGANLECVRFADARHGWIAGVGGFVARTRDGGATWTTKTFGGQAFRSVAFADTLNGWLVGDGGIYGTHDGGASWYLVQPSVTSLSLRGIARVSNTRAWAVGVQGTIASTSATSDSLEWSLANAGAGYQLNAIYMVSAEQGWTVGSNPSGAILVTSNGGATWTPQVASSSEALSGVYFADGLRGWAVGAAGRIVHTSTAGAP